MEVAGHSLSALSPFVSTNLSSTSTALAVLFSAKLFRPGLERVHRSASRSNDVTTSPPRYPTVFATLLPILNSPEGCVPAEPGKTLCCSPVTQPKGSPPSRQRKGPEGADEALQQLQTHRVVFQSIHRRCRRGGAP